MPNRNHQLELNPHIYQVKESATLAINQLVLAKRQQGFSLSHFGFGESPFAVPELIQQALKDNADQKTYLPTQGLPDLCQAIAHYYQEEFNYNYSADHIFVGPGSKELLFQLFYLLEGTLILPAPSWVSYGPQTDLLNKPTHIVQTRLENNYCLQAEELEQACQELSPQKQKLLIINSPNNPTGCVYPKETLQALAEICRKHQVIVISDEIYAKVDFTKGTHASITHYYPERTIVTGGLSKLFAAGGYRLGVALIPDSMQALAKALRVMISETFSCVSSPIQYAALAAYSNFNALKPYLEQCEQLHRVAGEYLHQRFIEMGLECPPPTGAFYLFPSFEPFKKYFAKRGITQSQQLCEYLVEHAQVAMLPGMHFYRPSNELTVRVSTTDHNGPHALRALQAGLSKEEIITKHIPNLVYGCDRLANLITTDISQLEVEPI